MGRSRKSNKNVRSATSNVVLASPSEDSGSSKPWWKWILNEVAVSFLSVIVAVVALCYNVHDRNTAIEAEQFKNANQTFVLNVITSDIKQLETGEIGKEIQSKLKNESSNPVFDVVLSAPRPLAGVSVSRYNYHEFSFDRHGKLNTPFPTLPPGEEIVFQETYSQDIFGARTPRDALNDDFFFCFTDVQGQRWLANYRGAHKISSVHECLPEE